MKKSGSLFGFGVWLVMLVYLPLSAMDMQKVDALAQQIKAGLGGVKSVEKKVVQQAKGIEEALPAVAKETKTISTSPSQEVSEESLGLRKSDLYSEDSTQPQEVTYTKAAPGSSKRFDRAFENAPPMIPHSVDGLLPITKNNNSCLGCHMPDVAPSMGATPIPPTHFTNFRPMTEIGKDGTMTKEGVEITNTSDIKIVARTEKKLYQGRFNCSQCHAPQAEVKPLVKNTFSPDFRKADEKKKSNLIDVMNEGVQ